MCGIIRNQIIGSLAWNLFVTEELSSFWAIFKVGIRLQGANADPVLGVG